MIYLDSTGGRLEDLYLMEVYAGFEFLTQDERQLGAVFGYGCPSLALWKTSGVQFRIDLSFIGFMKDIWSTISPWVVLHRLYERHLEYNFALSCPSSALWRTSGVLFRIDLSFIGFMKDIWSTISHWVVLHLLYERHLEYNFALTCPSSALWRTSGVLFRIDLSFIGFMKDIWSTISHWLVLHRFYEGHLEYNFALTCPSSALWKTPGVQFRLELSFIGFMKDIWSTISPWVVLHRPNERHLGLISSFCCTSLLLMDKTVEKMHGFGLYSPS